MGYFTSQERRVLFSLALLVIVGSILRFIAYHPLYDKSLPVPVATAHYSLININTATSQQLATITGIGPVLANRIVEYRCQNGLFKMIRDLIRVPGIGPKKLSTIEEFVTVDEGTAPDTVRGDDDNAQPTKNQIFKEKTSYQ